MRNNYYLFVFLVGMLFATTMSAQHPSCDGIRYSNYIFPAYDSTMGVQYGANTTFGGTPRNLLMDVFEPAGDQVAARPAIVFAFGGSFILGQRSDVHSFCRAFARLGYVACAIDYRLFDNFLFTDSSQAIDAVVKATHDMKAAIRFLREDAATSNTFKIDPNVIYAGGVSAGAITACHVAYLDSNNAVPQSVIDVVNANGGYEGTSNSLQRSSEVQGVINYSGALKDANWIDAGEAPMYSAHDDGDPTVPYGAASITVGFGVSIHLEGSASLKARCDQVGVNNVLYTIVNSGGHVSYLQNAANGAIVFAGTVTHLYDVTCPGIVGISDMETPEIKIYPNPAQNRVHLEVSEQWPVYNYQLYDATGKQVRARQGVEGLDNVIEVDNLPRGMYILRVQEGTGLGQYAEKRLILN